MHQLLDRETVHGMHRVSERPARRNAPAAVAAVAFALVALPAAISLRAPFNTTDEALLVVYGEELMSGRVPGADFFTVYGPGGFAMLAGAFHLFGVNVLVERLVGLLYQLVIVVGIMRLAERHGQRTSVTAGVLCALVLLPSGLTAYAWFGGLGLIIWSIALLTRGGNGAAFASGVLGGLASAWRMEMVVLNVAALPLLWRDRRLAPYLAGFALGSLPTVIWVVVAGRVAIENVFLSRMAINAQLELSEVPPTVWLLVGLSVILVGYVAVQAWLARDRELLAFTLLGVLVLPQAFQRIDLQHQVFALCLVLPLAAIARTTTGADVRRLTAIAARSVTGLVCLSLAFLFGVFAVAAAAPVTTVRHEGRSVLVESSKADDLEQLLDAVTQRVPKGSTVFIGAQDMSVPTLTDQRLYHLLQDYGHPWFYLELPPGVAEAADSPLADDVKQADALILTDVSEDVNRALFPHIGQGSENVNQLVADLFCEVKTVGRNRLYVRSSTTSADTSCRRDPR